MLDMNTVCDKHMCTGCGACVAICPKAAVRIQDNIRDLCSVIDINLCIKCGACTKVCPVQTPGLLQSPISWYQGWILDEKSRAKSSSGGFAYGIMKKFISDGGTVCSCLFHDGRFIYTVSKSFEELEAFRGSKYIKSDMLDVYKTIRSILQEGERLLFIGLPCHVAAIKKYIGEKYENKLYTIDLICHGSPSFYILEKYLQEEGIEIKDVENVYFRQKGKFGLRIKKGAKGDITIAPTGVRDRYSIGFLSGLFYTENCYNCRYAGLKRISDITIGDSWGSDMEGSEEGKKGISLALCQTKKGEDLLLNCDLKLYPVNIDNAIRANHQLQKPSDKPQQRALFFQLLDKGKSVHTAVGKCYPKVCFRQDIKAILTKIHMLKI